MTDQMSSMLSHFTITGEQPGPIVSVRTAATLKEDLQAPQKSCARDLQTPMALKKIDFSRPPRTSSEKGGKDQLNFEEKLKEGLKDRFVQKKNALGVMSAKVKWSIVLEDLWKASKPSSFPKDCCGFRSPNRRIDQSLFLANFHSDRRVWIDKNGDNLLSLNKSNTAGLRWIW